MRWNYLTSMWSDLEDAHGEVIATLNQDGAGWWWLRCRPTGRGTWKTVRRIWPQSKGERRLNQHEVYARAEATLKSLEAVDAAA